MFGCGTEPVFLIGCVPQPMKIDHAHVGSYEQLLVAVSNMNSIRTADLAQTHSFWMTMWNYLRHFHYCLSSDEMQKAITSLNKPTKHPFWTKLEEALWTLVCIPKEKGSVGIKVSYDIPAQSTSECLKGMTIEIPPELRRKFADRQPAVIGITNHTRFIYDANDLLLMGNICTYFPAGNTSIGTTETPFGYRGLYHPKRSVYSLSLIKQFMSDADAEKASSVICEPNAENIFLIHGRNGPLMISIRKKLSTWRMMRMEAGDNIRGIDAYVFI